MARWTPQKRDTLDALADEFLHNYAKGRTMLAVDGADKAGTSPFADALAERLARRDHAVFRASIDDFHRPRSDRKAPGNDSADGQYVGSYDYPVFRRVLVEPFRLGGSTGFVTAAWDVARDRAIQMAWQTGPQDATLVVDGLYLNRPELRGLWNYSIWLDDDFVADETYRAEADPRARATSIVDNTEADHPRRVFADSC